MATGRVRGLRSVMQRLFPERQFYHRSHGEVRFISLSARNQIGLVAVTLAFLSWVAYSSVNVVFKEQIISAKERNLTSVQADYEVRLSEMQVAYDELNSLLTLAQERFDEATKDLEHRHGLLKEYVTRHASSVTGMSELRQRLSENSDNKGGKQTAGTVLMQAVALEPTDRTSRVTGGTTGTEVTELAHLMRAVSTGRSSHHRNTMRVTNRVEKIDERIATLNYGRQEQLNGLEELTTASIGQYEAYLAATGLDIEDVLSRFQSQTPAVGGPFISMGGEAPAETLVESDDYQRQLFRLDAKLERLESLGTALTSIPLAMPLATNLRRSSGFGPRRDPFSRRTAFHSGLDFAGPRRSNVYATAPGKVVYAAARGPYGRLVEIDHGQGFKTRFGHLYRIKVKKGDNVDLGQVVGLLGSSGRSTGPHLHYEVWYKGKVRDPRNFLKAGRYVFQG